MDRTLRLKRKALEESVALQAIKIAAIQAGLVSLEEGIAALRIQNQEAIDRLRLGKKKGRDN
jgi:predicted transcriptional regulator